MLMSSLSSASFVVIQSKMIFFFHNSLSPVGRRSPAIYYLKKAKTAELCDEQVKRFYLDNPSLYKIPLSFPFCERTFQLDCKTPGFRAGEKFHQKQVFSSNI